MDDSNLLDDYLNGQLPPEERERFEQRLAQDSALREELALWREIREAVSDPRLASVRGHVRERLRQQPNKPYRRMMLWTAAVFALALIGALYYYWQARPQQRGKKLYAAHFQPNIQYGPERAGEGADSVQQAMDWALEQKNYPLLIQLMQKKRPAQHSSTYYLAFGQAWLLSGEPDSALAYLSQVSLGYEVEKNWLLAMAYLQAGRLAEAEPFLRHVADTSGPYTQEARNLLRDIQKK